MAAVADMGEVDEMHSKEEGVVLQNGELSNDIDMESQDSQESLQKANLSKGEPMEVDESELDTDDAKENKTETTSIPEENTEDESIEENTADTNISSLEAENQSTVDESSQETKTSENQTEESSEAVEKIEIRIEESDSKQDETEEKDEENEASENNFDESEDKDETNEINDETSKIKDKISEKSDEKVDTSIDEDEVDDKVEEKEVNSSSKMDHDESDSKNEEKILEISEEEEVHEINSDDEDEHEISESDPIELHDSSGEGDGDIMIVESPKENGTSTSEVIDLEMTPEKKSPKKITVTPRRSTRNLNKSKSYIECEKEATPEPEKQAQSSEESDIEEVIPQDPLGCSENVTVERIPFVEKPKPKKSATIVVKDTKKLVEIASKSNNGPAQGKKEPTLVIIDTNSILSGRGPVPVTKPALTTSGFASMLPIALPAQGMYPPNMRATITPIPMNTTVSAAQTAPPKSSPATITPSLNVPTPLLPTLTDDMFVVEAPSFIVPYVYEKPPMRDFKEFVKDLRKELDSDSDAKSIKKDDKGSASDGKDKVKIKSKDPMENDVEVKLDADDKKPYSYFESPLGKFFMNIGFNQVQEYVQMDLLKQQKRKRDREGGTNPETERTIQSLVKNLEYTKENNEPFKNPIKKCEFCNFKTESKLAMSYHLETPHMKNFVYRCNFCPYEIRSPHDILFHMEAEHAVRGHLERAPAFHQCPNCPFEDNQKGKLSRHLVTCMRKFKPDRNLEPPADWEPPAKIPRVPKMRQQGLNATAAAYQAMSRTSQFQFLSKMQLQSTQQAMQRGRGRPSLAGNQAKQPTVLRPSGMVFKQQAMSGGSVLVPTNYQLSGNQVFQNASPAKKTTQQPSISITPLPRTTAAGGSPVAPAKPGDTTSKNSFVICEICDGYIKDLEQLRNHMQWIHKIKIHPKMIYNRPPLNCQKCQFRFFTDQGLERHLLGSHGLVTSSMQDAANKSKDSGRCPVCGRVYQWKLLNHVARDHNMTLKPAHLSYKCTVCTATFGMYKQFENHVYSAHSVVAKRVMDKKGTSAASSAVKNELKPLKINDEITIIPQPAKSTNGANKDGSPSSTGSSNSRNSTPGTSKSR